MLQRHGDRLLPESHDELLAQLARLIGWLVSLFHNDDDIVGRQTRALRLYHATGSYYDKYELTTSKGIPVTMDFKDAGHYRVTGGWRLVA